METPKFILQLDNSAKKIKEKLWTRSDSSLSKVTNSKLNYLIRAALTLAILTTLVGGFLVVREYVNGNYPIYGTQRIGAICSDGWHSFSTGRGACSHHGGVDHWLYPQIGFHHMNPEPYLITTAFAFLFMIVFSIFSAAFRNRFSASLAEAGYGLGFIIYIAFFLAAIPFYILYSIIKAVIHKKE